MPRQGDASSPLSGHDEASLVAGLRAGDEHAYETVVRIFGGRLLAGLEALRASVVFHFHRAFGNGDSRSGNASVHGEDGALHRDTGVGRGDIEMTGFLLGGLDNDVSAIELALGSAPEATISVRGKDKFVVMDMAHYHYLRECELDAALAQTRADLAAGRTVQESPEAHLARLDAMNLAA